MPAKVQRVASGLLDILGLQTVGRGPALLADELVGTMDVTELYLQSRADIVTGNTSNINAVGFWPCATGDLASPVPSGELWYVHGGRIGPTVPLTAGTNYRCRAAARRDGDSEVWWSSNDERFYIAAEQPLLTLEPLWLPAGSILGIWCVTYLAGTALAWRVALRLTRILL